MTDNQICPKCQSNHVVRIGHGIKSGGIKTQRYRCFSCGYVYERPIGA